MNSKGPWLARLIHSEAFASSSLTPVAKGKSDTCEGGLGADTGVKMDTYVARTHKWPPGALSPNPKECILPATSGSWK